MMHVISKAIFTIVLLTSGMSLLAEPFKPSAYEMSLIEVGVSEQMLDPSSTIISNVIAADEILDSGDVITWVCGDVRGKNTFGGYSYDTPFIGTLLDTPKAGRAFILMSIATADAGSKLSVLQSCVDKVGQTSSAMPKASQSKGSVKTNFDQCVRQLCTSITQKNCWIKAGAAICDKDRTSCITVAGMTPATVVGREEGRWQVLTGAAQGWVSDHKMMINSAACSW